MRRVPTLGYGRIVFHTAEAETEEERVCIVVFKLTRLVVGGVVNRDIHKREARGDCLLRVSARNAGSIKSDIIRISIDGYVHRTRGVAIVDCADARRGRARLRFSAEIVADDTADCNDACRFVENYVQVGVDVRVSHIALIFADDTADIY